MQASQPSSHNHAIIHPAIATIPSSIQSMRGYYIDVSCEFMLVRSTSEQLSPVLIVMVVVVVVVAAVKVVEAVVVIAAADLVSSSNM